MEKPMPITEFFSNERQIEGQLVVETGTEIVETGINVVETATDVVEAGLDAVISAMGIIEIGTDVDGICTETNMNSKITLCM